jgi:hypothetical protein
MYRRNVELSLIAGNNNRAYCFFSLGLLDLGRAMNGFQVCFYRGGWRSFVLTLDVFIEVLLRLVDLTVETSVFSHGLLFSDVESYPPSSGLDSGS